jgi:hypothetical protein
MKLRSILLFFVLLSSVAQAAQKNLAGVVLASSFSYEGKELILQGGGLRKMFFLNVYVCGLYVEGFTSEASELVNGDEPMSIQLHIVSDMITSAQMVSSLRDGFDKSTGGNSDRYSQEMNLLVAAFSEKIAEGDIYDIVYTPEAGVEVYKNGVFQTSVGGLEFKQALWGIWLGEDPVDNNLKKALLGL